MADEPLPIGKARWKLLKRLRKANPTYRFGVYVRGERLVAQWVRREGDAGPVVPVVYAGHKVASIPVAGEPDWAKGT